jgi:hypothetical protein
MIQKELKITKTTNGNGQTNYMLQPTDGMDADEIIGILTRMLNVVMAGQPIQPKEGKKDMSYVG